MLLQAVLRRGRRLAAIRLLQACGARIVAFRELEKLAASVLQGAVRRRPALVGHGNTRVAIISLQTASRRVLARALYKIAR